MHPFRLLQRVLRPSRRRTAIVLLALQAGIAFAPLAEPAGAATVVAHVDEQGTNHHFAHNEATCAICSLRTLVADVPAATPVVMQASGFQPVAVDAHSRLASHEFRADHPSRAPPAGV
jgi:hypothetical protein